MKNLTLLFFEVLFFSFFGLVFSQYRKKREITFSSTKNYENIDLKIIINTQELVQNGDILNDCSDFKFISVTNGDVVIPFYISGGCGTTSTTFWLQYESVFSGVNRIAMYFGNDYYEDHDQQYLNFDGRHLYFLTTSSCPFDLQEYTSGKGKFVRSGYGESILESGGSNEHYHEIFGSLTASTNTSQVRTDGVEDGVSPSHIHEFNFSSGASSSQEPVHFRSRICSLSFSNIASRTQPFVGDNFFLLSDEDDLDTFYSQVVYETNSYDGDYIKLWNTYGPGPYGSSDHDHSYSSFCLESTSIVDYVLSPNPTPVVSISERTHQHTISGTTDKVDNDPYYRSFELYRTSSIFQDIPAGAAVLSDFEDPPPGFSSFYEENNYWTFHPFLRIGTDGDFGGTKKHSHTGTTTISKTSSVVIDASTRDIGFHDNDWVSSFNHVHSEDSISFSDTDFSSLSYMTFHVLKQKNGSQFEYVVGDSSNDEEIDWECFGISRLSNSTICNGKGSCIREDDCYCYPGSNFYGKKCSEEINQGFFERKEDYDLSSSSSSSSLSTYELKIPYVTETISIEDIQQEDSFYNMIEKSTFNCSFMIKQTSEITSSLNMKELNCRWDTESLYFTSHLVIDFSSSSAPSSLTPTSFIDQFPSLDIRLCSLFFPSETSSSSSFAQISIGEWIPDEDNGGGGSSSTFVTVFLILFFGFGSWFIIFCCCCFLLFIVAIVGGSMFFALFRYQQEKFQRFDKIQDIDLLLKEQEHFHNEDGKRGSHSFFKHKEHLFEISYDDNLEVVEKIGEGGSSTFIFKCLYYENGKKDKKKQKPIETAFKCFKITDLYSNDNEESDGEHLFKEFEREVSILGSINHPNILVFYGATIKLPRIGIVMEYCVNKDIKCYVEKYRKENKNRNAFENKEKIRLLLEIASAMSYLHSKNVIHRDLKPENVLLNIFFNAKVMDFGLSRVVENIMDQSVKTKRVGTSFYMAPEVVRGLDYDMKCDVFSYGILIWALIYEDFEPYGRSTIHNLEFKVASNPNFRPQIDLESVDSEIKFLIGLMKSCWNDDPSDRPLFDEILEHLVTKNAEVRPSIPTKTYKKYRNEKEEQKILKKESQELVKQRKEMRKWIEKYKKMSNRFETVLRKMGKWNENEEEEKGEQQEEMKSEEVKEEKNKDEKEKEEEEEGEEEEVPILPKRPERISSANFTEILRRNDILSFNDDAIPPLPPRQRTASTSVLQRKGKQQQSRQRTLSSSFVLKNDLKKNESSSIPPPIPEKPKSIKEKMIMDDPLSSPTSSPTIEKRKAPPPPIPLSPKLVEQKGEMFSDIEKRKAPPPPIPVSSKPKEEIPEQIKKKAPPPIPISKPNLIPTTETSSQKESEEKDLTKKNPPPIPTTSKPKDTKEEEGLKKGIVSVSSNIKDSPPPPPPKSSKPKLKTMKEQMEQVEEEKRKRAPPPPLPTSKPESIVEEEKRKRAPPPLPPKSKEVGSESIVEKEKMKRGPPLPPPDSKPRTEVRQEEKRKAPPPPPRSSPLPKPKSIEEKEFRKAPPPTPSSSLKPKGILNSESRKVAPPPPPSPRTPSEKEKKLPPPLPTTSKPRVIVEEKKSSPPPLPPKVREKRKEVPPPLPPSRKISNPPVPPPIKTRSESFKTLSSSKPIPPPVPQRKRTESDGF